MPPKDNKGALGSALFSDIEEPQEETQEQSNKWGKRGKDDYSQVCAQVPKQLHKLFKSKVALTDKDMATIIEELIVKYVEES